MIDAGVRARPGLRWPPLGTTVAVLLFAVAMAYLESAVVVYLRQALGVATGDVFPIDLSSELSGALGWIEIGREAATLVMIAAVGWLVGRDGLERLAWASVVFGAWDIWYYVWLWVFSGWPTSLMTWDLLFLIPAPWAGPVWAPVVVSLALIGFGLALIGLHRAGARRRATWRHLAALLAGGAVIIGAFLLNAPLVLEGGSPEEFAWLIFALGLGIGIAAAVAVLRTASSS